MAFNAEDFINGITWERFDELTKPKLIKLGQHLDLELDQSMRKQEIKNFVIDALVEENIFEESYMDKKVEIQAGTDSDAVKLKQLEIQKELDLKKLELEMKAKEFELQERLKIEEQERKEKLELEKEKLEMDKAIKQQELNAKLQMDQTLKQQELDAKLQMEEKERQERLAFEKQKFEKELEAKMALEQAKLDKHGSSSSSEKFDATKNIRLVPKFQETEVDKYFLHFEKIAESLKWPKESWTLLLQSVFIGKAREIYSSLSIEQCHSYDVVKKAVLKAYELVPEAYRQRFRSAKKETNQTHVEFARVQEQMLDRWLSSKNVNNEFKQLRELVLIEQFKGCIHADIKTHLDERDINNLEDAATTADDFALTHKLSTNNTGGPNKFNQHHKGNSNRPNQSKSSDGQKGTKEGNPQSGPSGQGDKDPSSAKPKSGDGFQTSVKCHFCKKTWPYYVQVLQIEGKAGGYKPAICPHRLCCVHEIRSSFTGC